MNSIDIFSTLESP